MDIDNFFISDAFLVTCPTVTQASPTATFFQSQKRFSVY